MAARPRSRPTHLQRLPPRPQVASSAGAASRFPPSRPRDASPEDAALPRPAPPPAPSRASPPTDGGRPACPGMRFSSAGAGVPALASAAGRCASVEPERPCRSLAWPRSRAPLSALLGRQRTFCYSRGALGALRPCRDCWGGSCWPPLGSRIPKLPGGVLGCGGMSSRQSRKDEPAAMTGNL